MSSLADVPELVGFFSYSRDDDLDSNGALSALRDRIQRELRGQLGRSFKDFRLWQDKEAIAPGKLWQSEIERAVAQSTFFIPIVTPTAVKSPFCKVELDLFLAREKALRRSDLVFPILYIRVPALDNDGLTQNDPVLSLIAKRQYVDWRPFRHRDINSTEMKEMVAWFCANIVKALHEPWLSAEDSQRMSAEESRKRGEHETFAEEAEPQQRAKDDRIPQLEKEGPRGREGHRAREETAGDPGVEARAARVTANPEERDLALTAASAEISRRPKRNQGQRIGLSAALMTIFGIIIAAAIGVSIVFTTAPTLVRTPTATVAGPGGLRIVGSDSLVFTGREGGPFDPPKLSLELKSSGPGLQWSTSEIPEWLSVAPTEGKLAAGTSTEVALTLAPATRSFLGGHYQGKLIFRSLPSGNPVIQDVRLLVVPTPQRVVRPVVHEPLTPERERALQQKDTFKECALCPEMVVMPPGSFMMGSPEHERDRGSGEGPQHLVRFSRPFAVGRFAVTFDEWDACVADGGCGRKKLSDQGWGRGMRPVINATWDDAKAYVAWLAAKTKRTYRLLSEAEREYVARAGTSTPFWWGSSISVDQANYNGNHTYGSGQRGTWRRQTVPVNSFQPNPWGLYQVHGNIYEWVEDCASATYDGTPPTDGSPWLKGDCKSRMLRGGSWVNAPRYLRAAHRNSSEDGNTVGFRVARTLSP